MSFAHIPSVFVSSTCYDLAQVRLDLRSFFESLGMDPILSEFSSFPVDPSLDAIKNCQAGIKEKADIFILVVGGIYGSQTDTGKSITNLEYLEAKVKGIPRYVFVQDSILNMLPVWQRNRSGDFSGIVDSTKLFDFVESLRDPKENWVFPFKSAQDITNTLRIQLAYLFKDALEIRTKVLSAGLPVSLQDLSGSALVLAVQKPFAWEHRLFGQVLFDEISQMAGLKKDLKYGITLGKAVRIDDLEKIIKWVKIKFGEIQSYINSANSLFKAALPKALGEPGEPGDIEEIVYVSKRLAEVYRRILEWTMEFRHTQVDDEFRRLLEIVSRISENAIEEIEEFALNINRQLDDAVRAHEETKQPQTLKITLTLTCPDLPELDDELRRLYEVYGL